MAKSDPCMSICESSCVSLLCILSVTTCKQVHLDLLYASIINCEPKVSDTLFFPHIFKFGVRACNRILACLDPKDSIGGKLGGAYQKL